MPVYSLEGTPGAGKTLYCVQKIIPDFLRIRDVSGDLVPRHIYTNIEGLKPWLICAYLNIPYEAIADYFHVLGQVVDEDGKVHEDKDLVRYWMFKPESIRWQTILNGNKQQERVPVWEECEQIERGSLVIIDEVQNYYGARDFATNYSKRVIDYITKNRHYGWTLWWMTQSIESVDVTFRRNTECVHFLERKENYGQSNSASVKKYEGWLAGNKSNIPPFSTGTFRYDKRFFACYSSYVQGVQGEKRYKTNIFLSHKGFMAVLIIFVLCVLLVLFTNPLDTISHGGGALENGDDRGVQPAKQQAARPAVTSFSDTAGREAVKIDSVCVENYFIVGGESWAMLSTGKRVKVKQGARYAVCD